MLENPVNFGLVSLQISFVLEPPVADDALKFWFDATLILQMSDQMGFLFVRQVAFRTEIPSVFVLVKFKIPEIYCRKLVALLLTSTKAV